MFATIRSWFMGGDPPGRGIGTGERPESLAQVERARGLKIIEAVPRRREILEDLKALLLRIPERDRAELVDETAVRFALYVGDLPASERNHHSGPFGLLDHSLDVALRAVRELARPSFRPSEDPVANHREQPIWAFAGFVLGLLHDVGKLLDLEVFATAEGPAWDPLAEPLTTYLARYGRGSSESGMRRWKVGRRLHGHDRKAPPLAPLVLPPRTLQFLGKRLAVLLEAFERSYETGKEEWGANPAVRVAGAVRRADQVSSGEQIQEQVQERAQESAASRARLEVQAGPLTHSPGGEAAEEAAEDASEERDIPGAIPERVEALELPFPVESFSPSLPGFGAGANAHSKIVPAAAALRGGSERKAQEAREREPRPKSARGLDVESLLPPERLLESIRSWLRSGNMSRNSANASVLVRQDFIWLRYPDAFTNLLRGKGISWSPQVAEKLLSWLLRLPHVAPENPKTALVHALSGARGAKSGIFVRFHARDFLPEKELASLGYWPFEMTVQPTTFLQDREKPPRAAEGGGAQR